MARSFEHKSGQISTKLVTLHVSDFGKFLLIFRIANKTLKVAKISDQNVRHLWTKVWLASRQQNKQKLHKSKKLGNVSNQFFLIHDSWVL